MQGRNKLSIYLNSKTTLTNQAHGKTEYLRSKNQTIDDHRYINKTLQMENAHEYRETKDKLNYRQRNHTQNKYNRHSAVTINIKNRPIPRQRIPYSSISKSDNLERHKYMFRPTENLKEEKLLMIREERINKLKGGLNMKNRMNGDRKVTAVVSNYKARFNSFTDLKKKKEMLPLLEKNSKEKRENKQVEQEKGTVNIPRFFNFCESNRYKQEVNKPVNQSFQQNSLPKPIPQINKVKSMKKIAQTPPLAPVTLQKQLKQQINLDWIKKSYRPFLDIFKNIKFDTFSIIKMEKGVYFGELRAGTSIIEGKGVFFYQNGKIFEGHFIQGQRHGLGYELYPDRSSYMGNFEDGKREGKGRFQWNNGQVYDGEWKSGKKYGSGIWKNQNGLSYVGEWRGDIIEGFGVLTEKQSRYEGQFKNFMKWGNGTMRFQNGQTFTGFFKQNLPNGEGDYFWTNGDHYHGDFINGKRHGQGYIKYANGGSYKGQFKNDKKSGYGQQSYQNNLCYEGCFENDLKHGWGILLNNHQHLFQGYWLNNVPIDPKKGSIQTIAQQQSIYEKDKQPKQRLAKIQSSASMIRNKFMMKKQNNRQKSLSKQKSLTGSSDEIKPFRRACNCQRHRLKNQQPQ